MKIAQIAPLVERVPPKKYGGTERVIFALTEELVKRGHEVTLFASGDSITSAGLVSVVPKNMRESQGTPDIYGLNVYELHNIGLAYEMQEHFDIIHDHTFPHSLPAANLAKTPVLFTVHRSLARADIQCQATASSLYCQHFQSTNAFCVRRKLYWQCLQWF